jgi:hypothetical protein
METLEFEKYSKLQADVLAYLSNPKCAKCKIATPEEFTCPFWWEAGEWVCDPCGKDARPGGRHPNKRRFKVDA